MDSVKQPTEHEEQKAIVRWLRNQGIMVFAVPNGGLRDAITSRRLKDEGAMAGIPDLCIAKNFGETIWVEMKTRQNGRLSPIQIATHERLKSLGHTVLVCHGATDAKQQLEKVLCIGDSSNG